MPDETAIPLLGTCPGKSRVHKGPCSPVFAAAPFTKTKAWNQRTHPSTDEWIKKVRCVCVYTHTHTHTHRVEYYSTIKKKEILPFAATQTDPETSYEAK